MQRQALLQAIGRANTINLYVHLKWWKIPTKRCYFCSFISIKSFKK